MFNLKNTTKIPETFDYLEIAKRIASAVSKHETHYSTYGVPLEFLTSNVEALEDNGTVCLNIILSRGPSDPGDEAVLTEGKLTKGKHLCVIITVPEETNLSNEN